MGFAGRKPLPPNVHELRGNPGKRPINKDAPAPDRKAPPIPSYLDPEARQEWKRVAPALVRLGLLTEIDGAVFAGYCESVAMLARVNRQIKKTKYALLAEKHTVDGAGNEHLEIKQSPLFVMKRQVLMQIRSFCSEFGMTASSRGRMTVPGIADPDPQEDFLNGR